MEASRQMSRCLAGLTAFLTLAAMALTPARALPSFAVQTGQACGTCHVGGLGPQLTPFGRNFKLRGYTARAVDFNVPLTAFAITSYVRTQKDQAVPPAPGTGVNNNFAIDQISLFLAGGWGHHWGAFVQSTYDGVSKTFHWDNLDLRAVTTAKVGRNDVVLGVSMNNNPTVQDGFNTLYAWGFPYTGSSLAPRPSAGPFIASLPQESLGLTVYAWINSQLYAEIGGYRTPSSGFLRRAGSNPAAPGRISGVAPYARLAYQKTFGDSNLAVGAFAMDARIFPGRDQTTGFSDHYTDLGLDAAYQHTNANRDIISVNARYTLERQSLEASQVLGLVRRADGRLKDARIDASYYWRNKIGATAQVFQTWGTGDDLLFGADRNFKPDTSGLLLQLDATPFGDAGSPLGPRFNLRVGVQYTAYVKFNGAGRNYDGLGRNAGDNNTLRVFTWIYY